MSFMECRVRARVFMGRIVCVLSSKKGVLVAKGWAKQRWYFGCRLILKCVHSEWKIWLMFMILGES